MLATIWDDIDYEAEAIVVSDIKYDPTSLSNITYEMLYDKVRRRQILKRNKVKGLYKDLDQIRAHSESVESDENVSMLINGLFQREEIPSITPLDRVFVNSYYRRLLRAKIERDYIGRELVPGLVITEYTNGQVDTALVTALRLLRVICKFLGIESTTTPDTFPLAKLEVRAFWSSMADKFIPLFGEARVMTVPDEDSEEEFTPMQVIMFLHVIFTIWSGTTLLPGDNTIKVVPAVYVSRLLPKLR